MLRRRVTPAGGVRRSAQARPDQRRASSGRGAECAAPHVVPVSRGRRTIMTTLGMGRMGALVIFIGAAVLEVAGDAMISQGPARQRGRAGRPWVRRLGIVRRRCEPSGPGFLQDARRVRRGLCRRERSHRPLRVPGSDSSVHMGRARGDTHWKCHHPLGARWVGRTATATTGASLPRMPRRATSPVRDWPADEASVASAPSTLAPSSPMKVAMALMCRGPRLVLR